MKQEIILSLTKDFESFAQHAENGLEFWFARDLQHLLGYSKWENFQNVISKAKTACEISGHEGSDHFPDIRKMVSIGSGAEKEIDDLMLTRYACYLIAQNSEKELSSTIYQQTGGNRNFAFIRSKGDAAFFGGKNTADMKIIWKTGNRPIADFMPTILLKAKDFSTEITIHKAKENKMNTEKQISNEHITNNKTVRNALISRGIVPEKLAPAEDVKKVERKVESEKKKNLKKISKN